MADDPRTLHALPQPWDLETNPVPIVGQGTDWEFTADQSWDYYHPAPPQGYDTWSEYVLAVLDAQEQGGTGPTPMGPYGSMAGADVSPAEFLKNMGVGRLGPLLDMSNPKLAAWARNAHYDAMGTDQMNIFGDQFFNALMGLGVVGGAYAAGGIFPGATVGGEAAAAGGAGSAAGAGAAEAAGDLATIGTAAGETLAASDVIPAAAASGAVGAAPASGGGGILNTVAGLLGGAGGGGGTVSTLADLAPILGSLISGGVSLIGGARASGAAKDAAETQTRATEEANKLLLDIYNQTRADYAPYQAAGYAALGDLAKMSGSPYGTAPFSASTQALDPSAYQFNPGQYAFAAPNQALNPSDYTFSAPNKTLNPQDYRFAPTSGWQVLQDDPSYQFRLGEGYKALQASQAAKGNLISGGAYKALGQYGQDYASQEYEKAYTRALGRNQMEWQRAQYGNEEEYQRALALNQMNWQRGQYGNEQTYNRALAENQLGYERGYNQNQRDYERAYGYNRDLYNRETQEWLNNYNAGLTGRQQQWNELAQLAGYGTASTGQLANAGANLGQSVGGNITSSGAAQAAGQIGAANAMNQGFAGVGNAVNSYLNYLSGSQQNQQNNQTNQLLNQLIGLYTRNR